MLSYNSSSNNISALPRTLSPVIVILGPTAVGKTEISIQLANRLNGEIISADSRLFYKGMDIGTAKPSKADQVFIHHHLIDIVNPDETMSLAQFQLHANRAIFDIHQRNCLPFLVGGTGQYIHAITEGWHVPSVKPNQQLRQALEKWLSDITPIGMNERLKVLDPQAALSIDPRNTRRMIRALEVILQTGKRFSAQRSRSSPPYQILQIGLTRPRSELYNRVDQRIDHMIKNGFLEEVRHLLELGYSPDLPTMSAIGYHEICMYLQNNLSLEEAVTLMKRRTRVFIRRQANWFKLEDSNIHWFQCNETTIVDIEQTIRSWLAVLE